MDIGETKFPPENGPFQADPKAAETPAEKMALQLAERIHEMGLDVPAILFLELHRPFASVVYNSALFAQPFLTPFFGLERVQGFLEFLNRRDSLEFLVKAIEANRGKN